MFRVRVLLTSEGPRHQNRLVPILSSSRWRSGPDRTIYRRIASYHLHTGSKRSISAEQLLTVCQLFMSTDEIFHFPPDVFLVFRGPVAIMISSDLELSQSWYEYIFQR